MPANTATTRNISAPTTLTPVIVNPPEGTHNANAHAAERPAAQTTPMARPSQLIVFAISSFLDPSRRDDDRGREHREPDADAETRADQRADRKIAEHETRTRAERRAPQDAGGDRN